MRKVLLVVIAAFLAAGVRTAACAATPPAPWGQDGFGPGNTHYNPAESAINASSIDRLRLHWTVTAAAGVDGCTPASVAPLVAGDRVFMIDHGGVAAYDLRSGRRLWLDTSFSLIRTPLIVAGGLVLILDTNCYSNSSYETRVTALDAVTGVRKWEKSSNWTIDTAVADSGTLAVSGYCGTCDDADHGVDAFRISDGRKVWSHRNELLAGPVSAGGRVLLHRTIADGGTHVARITDGVPDWGTSGTVTAAAATPDGSVFYLATGEGLAALDAGSGRQRWQIPHETGDLADDGNRVYVASAGRINTYDARTGALQWTRALTDPRFPVRAGGLLYTVTGPGKLVVLSPVTGKRVHTKTVYTGLTDHVVAAAGKLLTLEGSTIRAYAP